MSDLSDLPGDDAVELASRYLDGDLAVDERAAAEADPDVMAWVERFGGIQHALREPVDVDAGARDTAIAAALAALDEEPAGEEVAPPPGVGDLAAARARRTPRLGRWLGAAAAIAALAAGGAALVANSDGRDDSADESFAAAAEVDAPTGAADKDEAADAASSPMAAPAAGEFESTTAADASRDAQAATTTPTGGDSQSDDDAGGAPATTEAAGETTAAGGSGTTTAPVGTVVESYRTPADLQALADARPVTLPEGSVPPCAEVATGELVAIDVEYAGVPAVVYRDAAIDTLTAWAVGSCERLDDYVYAAG